MILIFFRQPIPLIMPGCHLLLMIFSVYFHPQLIETSVVLGSPDAQPDGIPYQIHLSIHNESSILYKSVSPPLFPLILSQKNWKMHTYRVRLYVVREEEFDELCSLRQFPDSESPWFALLPLTEFCSSPAAVKTLIKRVLQFQRDALKGVLLYTESSKLTYNGTNLFENSDAQIGVFVVHKDLAPDLPQQCAASNFTCYLSLGLPFAPHKMSAPENSNTLPQSKTAHFNAGKKINHSDRHDFQSSRIDQVLLINTSSASRNNVRFLELLGLDRSAAAASDRNSASSSNLSVLSSAPTHNPQQVLSSPSPRLSLVSSRVRYDNASTVLHAKLDNVGPGSSSEDALLNRSSVLFVAVSFILLMIISLGWLIFYYIQRFRYLHSKERASRRLAELARKAVARIPVKLLRAGDKEIGSNGEHCAICIEPYRPFDNIRILPCRHYFHKVCIDPWLLEQRSCPMCKLDILQAYGLRPYVAFSFGEDSSLSHGGGGFHTDESGPAAEEATTTVAVTTDSPVNYISPQPPAQLSGTPDGSTAIAGSESPQGNYSALRTRKPRASTASGSSRCQTCAEIGVESPTHSGGQPVGSTIVAASVDVTRSLSEQLSSPLLTASTPLCPADYSTPLSTCPCANTPSASTMKMASCAEQGRRKHRLSLHQHHHEQQLHNPSSAASITQSKSSDQVVSQHHHHQQQHEHLLARSQPPNAQTFAGPSNPSNEDLTFLESQLHPLRPTAQPCTDAQAKTPPSLESVSGVCGSTWEVGTSSSSHDDNKFHSDMNCGSRRQQQKARKRASEGPVMGWLSRGFHLTKPLVRHRDKGERNAVLPSETVTARFRHRRTLKGSTDTGSGTGAAAVATDFPVSVKLMSPSTSSSSRSGPASVNEPTRDEEEAALVECRLLSPPQQPQTCDESCSVAPLLPAPGGCKEKLIVAVVELPSNSAAHSSSSGDSVAKDSTFIT